MPKPINKRSPESSDDHEISDTEAQATIENDIKESNEEAETDVQNRNKSIRGAKRRHTSKKLLAFKRKLSPFLLQENLQSRISDSTMWSSPWMVPSFWIVPW